MKTALAVVGLWACTLGAVTVLAAQSPAAHLGRYTVVKEIPKATWMSPGVRCWEIAGQRFLGWVCFAPVVKTDARASQVGEHVDVYPVYPVKVRFRDGWRVVGWVDWRRRPLLSRTESIRGDWGQLA